MQTKKKIETEVIIESCDICNTGNVRTHTCPICGCDVCVQCSVSHDMICDLTAENSFNGDYPLYICRPCWNKGKEIREQIQDIRNKSDEDEEKLMRAWTALCKPIKSSN